MKTKTILLTSALMYMLDNEIHIAKIKKKFNVTIYIFVYILFLPVYIAELALVALTTYPATPSTSHLSSK
jgi:hypothetical protein